MLDTKFPANQSTSQKPIRSSGYAQSISREKALNDERDPQRDACVARTCIPSRCSTGQCHGLAQSTPRRARAGTAFSDWLCYVAAEHNHHHYLRTYGESFSKNGRIMQIVWLASSCGPAVKPAYHICRLRYRTYDVGMHVPTIQENLENLCRVPFVPCLFTTINSQKDLWKTGKPAEVQVYARRYLVPLQHYQISLYAPHIPPTEQSV
ncbi:hypothetical protein F4806DRAFT_410287 [Annulohypoxylon nitens]|nr:hypothetical protein F4806DRAFT_410287 [Annulohypoxylon nitens]